MVARKLDPDELKRLTALRLDSRKITNALEEAWVRKMKVAVGASIIRESCTTLEIIKSPRGIPMIDFP